MLPSIPTKYPILVYSSEMDEIMHGIGLKQSSHHVNANGEVPLSGSCSKALSLSAQQKKVSFIYLKDYLILS